MKTFITTRGVQSRMKTHQTVPNDTILVCHGKEDARRLIDITGLEHVVWHDADKVFENPTDTRRMGYIRDFVQREFTVEGEWYCLLDDNSNIVKVPDPYYQEDRIEFSDHFAVDFRQLYRTPITPQEFAAIQEEIRQRCILQGTTFGGVSAEENFYFRSKKWSVGSYVRGKMMIVQNDGVPWVFDENIRVLTDMARTARCIYQYGSVAVNRYVHTMYKPWEPGGIGNLDQRSENLKHSGQWLVDTYSGLIDWYKDSDVFVHVRLHSQKQIDKWRAAR